LILLQVCVVGTSIEQNNYHKFLFIVFKQLTVFPYLSSMISFRHASSKSVIHVLYIIGVI